MITKIIGIINLLLGLILLLRAYKNRKIISITTIFHKKDKYVIVNEKKFLKLQNIKSFYNALSCIGMGVIVLFWWPEGYLFSFFIIGTDDYIFSNLAIEYVKLKL